MNTNFTDNSSTNHKQPKQPQIRGGSGAEYLAHRHKWMCIGPFTGDSGAGPGRMGPSAWRSAPIGHQTGGWGRKRAAGTNAHGVKKTQSTYPPVKLSSAGFGRRRAPDNSGGGGDSSGWRRTPGKTPTKIYPPGFYN